MSFDDLNRDLGNGIFLTWSGTLKDLPKAKQLARRMAEGGTTFRGCSFDKRVYVKEECPVCGCFGLKEWDTPYDQEDLPDRKPAVGKSHWQPRQRKTR